MELKEVRKHLGERVYVESKPAYNRYIGTYILEGIMQVCELDKDDKEVWDVQIKLQEINAKNCSIWIDFKGAVIKFLGRDEGKEQKDKCTIPQSPAATASFAQGSHASGDTPSILHRGETSRDYEYIVPCDEKKDNSARTIEDIQQESLEKLRALCQ